MTLIFEYRLLRAKTDRLAITLGDAELCRLAGLERLLAGDEDPNRDPRRAMARAQLRAFVRYTLHNAIGAGELTDVSAGGARIEASHPPAVGAPVLVAIQIPPAYEFVFPGSVVWRTSTAFGLAFDGIPTRRRVTHPVRTLVRPPVPLRPAFTDLVSINDGDDERSSITEVKCKTPIPEGGTGSTS
ncbi:MAG: PilZ domain-containing protein [Deltaproteobacteria bacterium]|nr:PilZ domain-containing protein [Deltaproteobacteria bacterium]